MAGNNGQGQKWIRNERRVALYLRDGLACCYCGATLEDGTVLTLDHLQPRSQGGSNDSTNLVTACMRCNSARADRDWQTFAAKVADYLNHNVTVGMIISHIETTRQRPVDVKGAKEIIEHRGGFSATMQSMQ